MEVRQHKVPRKINVPPPMILGLSGPQSFAWVASMIIMGIIASSFNTALSAIAAWVTMGIILFIEVAVLRFINGKRRSLISHTFSRWRSMATIRRYAGRGVSYAWGGKGHKGGERPY